MSDPRQPKSIAHRTRQLQLLAGFALVVSLGCAALEQTYHFGFAGTDDANIFFRYARNVVNGSGIVYNPHGEPVEGFTSTLWFVIGVYAQLFGKHSTVALLVLNVLLAAASLGLVTLSSYGQLRSLGLRVPLLLIAWCVAASALLHPAWLLWNVTSLMDTGLYTFCVTFAWAALELLRRGSRRAPLALGTAAVLLVLCRPEGIGWWVLLTLGAIIVGRLCGVPRALRSRAVRAPLLAGLVTIAALYGWRLLTFHMAMPNPLYAKVSASAAERLRGGLEHALSYLRIHPVWLGFALLLPLAGFALRRLTDSPTDPGTLRRSRRARSVALALFMPWIWVVAGWLPPTLAGGDVFGGHRFFQVVSLLLVPPMLLGASLLFRPFLSSRHWIWIAAAPGAVLAIGAYGHWQRFADSNTWGSPLLDPSEHVASEFAIATADRRHGERLSALFGDSLPRIAYAAAGGIAVGYPGVIYDMMGLNDPEIARRCRGKSGPLGHACFDRDRFFALAPDAILARAVAREDATVNVSALARELRRPGNWDNTIFRRLFSDPEFNTKYRMVRISRSGSPWSAYGHFSVEYLLNLAVKPEFQLEFAQ